MFVKAVYTQQIDKFFKEQIPEYTFDFGCKYYCVFKPKGFLDKELVAALAIYKENKDDFLCFAINDSYKKGFFSKSLLKQLYEIVFKNKDFVFAHALNQECATLLKGLCFKDYAKDLYILSADSVRYDKWQKIIK